MEFFKKVFSRKKKTPLVLVLDDGSRFVFENGNLCFEPTSTPAAPLLIIEDKPE